MEKPDYTDKCYQTKDDKRHKTVFSTSNLANESKEAREERLKNINEFAGVWVYDERKKEVVRKEIYEADKDRGNPAFNVSRWNPEWALVSTGKRMSKSELKRYCKEKGKIWENG
jgi:hypothetical protein